MKIQEIIAQRLQERNSEDLHDSGEQEYVETFESSPFFGADNVRHAPACLELRLKDGTFKAIPYPFILEVNYDPSEGIEILTTSKRLMITGRNLKLLFNFLTAFRVKFIKANAGHDLTEEKALFVKDILIDEA